MTDERDTSVVARRQWLALAGGSLSAALAGCLGGNDSGDASPDDDGTTDDDSPIDDDGSTDDDDTDDDTPSDDDDTDDDSPTDGDDTDDDRSADPGDSALQDLRIGEIPNVATLGVGDDEPVSVTLVSQEDSSHEFTVDLTVTPADTDSADPEPVHTDSQSVPLDAGAEQRVTFGAVTPNLDAGLYDVVATTPAAEASAELTVAGTTEATVRVFLQSADGQPAQDGQLAITDGSTEVASTPIAPDEHPTVELPGAESTSYTAEVTNVNGGVLPDTSTQFDLGGGDPTDGITVDVVAGYEFKGDIDVRFTSFIIDESGGPAGQEYETVMYGSYSNPASYHVYYINGTTGGVPGFTVEDSPPEYGADLHELRWELGTVPPSHALAVGTEKFFYPGSRERWEPADDVFNSSRVSHNIATGGLGDFTGLDPEMQQYVGTDTVRGIDIDVYEVPPRDATVYVDPETGLTIRYEATSLGEDRPDSYEVVEFFDYGEHDTVDWELIKARSEHETGENLDGEELEQLPWEIVGPDAD